MKKTEITSFVKDSAVDILGVASTGTKIGNYTYVIGSEVEGDTHYAKVTISYCEPTDTYFKSGDKAGQVRTHGFNIDEAVQAYAQKVAEAEAKAAAKAAKDAE